MVQPRREAMMGERQRPLKCVHSSEPTESLGPNTAMMRCRRIVQLGTIRRLVILAIVFGFFTLLYLRRHLSEKQQQPRERQTAAETEFDNGVALVLPVAAAPESGVGYEGGEKEDETYEVQSEFQDMMEPPVNEPVGNRIVSSLRSLIGIGGHNSGQYPKTEIKLNSHVIHSLDVLEGNLFKNSIHDTHAETLEADGRDRNSIHIPPLNETEIDGKDLPGCTPNKCRDRMVNLFGDKFNPSIQPFVNRYLWETGVLQLLPPPFGFYGSEGRLQNVMLKVNRTDFGNTEIKPCMRCVVVGSGGIMKDSALGGTIDEYDVVIRLNDAPTRGFERDVGFKTTFRMAYPESGFTSPARYRDHWLFLLVVFKPADLEWLADVISGKKVRSSLRFWKSVAREVPKPANEFRIFNPLITREACVLMGASTKNGKMFKNVPTTGYLAITMALHICDEVSAVGFGYVKNKPLHYYDSKNISAIKGSWTHNFDQERAFLRKLVRLGVIRDLSGGLTDR